MVRLDEIFDIWYGVNLEVVNCEVTEKGIPFVSRQSTNNGINCNVKPIENITPNPANTLSIAASGSVLTTFFHEYEYYSGRDVYIAKPKKELSKTAMLYYCYVIEQNKYRYNYGRAANRTLRNILVPTFDKLPNEIKNQETEYELSQQPLSNNKISLDERKWEWFRYDEVFEIKKGFYNKKPLENPNGEIPFIGGTEFNNGVTSYHDLEEIEKSSKTGDGNNADISEKLFDANCITVSNDGSIGYAFYQKIAFTCSHSVTPLLLKDRDFNPYIAMFICSLIEMEQFRWAYGRKWRPERMPSS
ncbi:MAG: restriction endonuclease subunit S, partial [Bacteroidota bacterium]|nr:restriction endonuclease subunit S [Bacteroidota bacterium]